jgi:hypothetical protein
LSSAECTPQGFTDNVVLAGSDDRSHHRRQNKLRNRNVVEGGIFELALSHGERGSRQESGAFWYEIKYAILLLLNFVTV